MKESKVEKHFTDQIAKQGGIAYKFVSPNVRGVPDRIVLRPIPLKHRAIVSKYFYFVECKAPGKRPRPDQKREHKRLRALGFVVKIIDSKG